MALGMAQGAAVPHGWTTRSMQAAILRQAADVTWGTAGELLRSENVPEGFGSQVWQAKEKADVIVLSSDDDDNGGTW